MDRAKRKRLEAAGWKVGTVRHFLDLSAEEEAYLEIKLQLAKDLQKRRREKKLTQVDLARMLKSSQSRIAKIDAGESLKSNKKKEIDYGSKGSCGRIRQHCSTGGLLLFKFGRV